jgi:hypothetical protein
MKAELYLTSDHSLAAFLCMRGYTLLGAVDNGTERKEFALTHYELRKTPELMKEDLLKKTQEFTLPFDFPNDDSTHKVSFKEYNIKLRMCKKALQFPVDMEKVA